MDRLTAEMALQHPYMSPYSCPEDEPISQHPFRIEDEIDDILLMAANQSQLSNWDRCGSRKFRRCRLELTFPFLFRLRPSVTFPSISHVARSAFPNLPSCLSASCPDPPRRSHISGTLNTGLSNRFIVVSAHWHMRK